MIKIEHVILRLASGAGADRELDLSILNSRAEHEWRWRKPGEIITCDRYGAGAIGNPTCSLEHFTASLRDALSLVPTDAHWLLGMGKIRPDEPLYAMQIIDRDDGHVITEAEHDDAARCICIAALRARLLA